MALPSIMEQDPNMPAYTPNHTWHSRRGGSPKHSDTINIALTEMPARPTSTEMSAPSTPTELPPRTAPSSKDAKSKRFPINIASLNLLKKKTSAMTAKEVSNDPSTSLEANCARRANRSKFYMSPRSRRWLCFGTPILMVIIGIAILISFLVLHLKKHHAESDASFPPPDTKSSSQREPIYIMTDDGEAESLNLEDIFPGVDLDRILPHIHMEGSVKKTGISLQTLHRIIQKHFLNLGSEDINTTVVIAPEGWYASTFTPGPVSEPDSRA